MTGFLITLALIVALTVVVTALSYLFVVMALAGGEALFRRDRGLPPLTTREVLTLSFLEDERKSS